MLGRQSEDLRGRQEHTSLKPQQVAATARSSYSMAGSRYGVCVHFRCCAYWRVTGAGDGDLIGGSSCDCPGKWREWTGALQRWRLLTRRPWCWRWSKRKGPGGPKSRRGPERDTELVRSRKSRIVYCTCIVLYCITCTLEVVLTSKARVKMVVQYKSGQM